MKTQKRFVISGMLKRYTILGACVMLVALFASAAQAETVMVDPGPASSTTDFENDIPGEIKYAQDFIIDNQTNTSIVDVLWTDSKVLDWNTGNQGKQPIVLYGPDGCAPYQGQLLDTFGEPIPGTDFDGKFGPCDGAELTTILNDSNLFGAETETIGGIRLDSDAPGFSADGNYGWSWQAEELIASLAPAVWQLSDNQPPIADPGGSYTGTRGEDVSFDGSKSRDPDGDDGDTLNYNWDFGDGGIATQDAKPFHSYDEAGTYNVCLTVTDDDQASDTKCTTAEIDGDTEGPLADANGPYTADSNGIVYFNGTGSSGQISDYLWDFGDGTTSTLPSPIKTYDNTVGGEYDVTLTVTDTSDLTDVDITTATVAQPESNLPPVADAGGPYTGYQVGEEIPFDGTGSYDPNGDPITQYDWFWGDDGGISDGGPNPTHAYSGPGSYSVRLTVSDGVTTGDDYIWVDIFEEGAVPPVADAKGPYTGEVGVPVIFDGSDSYDPDNPDGENLQYVWFFGDGDYSFEPAPSHAYDAADAFSVDLYVIDSDGNIAWDNTSANIGFGDNEPPIADAGGPYSGVVNVPVPFNGTRSYDPTPDGEIVSWEWDFGDGGTSFDPEPEHTYLQPGRKVVTLKVTDDGGAYDQDTINLTINDGNLPPVADPGGPYLGQVGVPKTFDGSESFDRDGGTITTYEWDFGDGSDGVTSSDPTATHVYDRAGYFTAVLYVTDNDGLTDAQHTYAGIGLTSAPPEADAGGPYTGTRGTPVLFNGSESSDLEDDISTYAWDFGDSNDLTPGTGPKPQHTYAETGTYFVRLKVTDGSGETDRDLTKVTIGEGDLPPVADAGGPYTGEPGALVPFDGTGSNAPGGISTYAWDFGDPNDSTPGTGPTPSHTYSARGIYLVTLTVTDSDGGTNSDTTSVRIFPYMDEIIATWSNGIWYRNLDTGKWTQLSTDTTTEDIAAADFTADGIADVAAIFQSGPPSDSQGPGIYYLDGVSKAWTLVPDSAPAPSSITAGDLTGDGRPEVIATWSGFGFWYWNFAAATPAWIQLSTDSTTEDIAAADFTADGIADVAAIFEIGPASDPQGAGLYYLDGDSKAWTRVPLSDPAPFSVTAGDLTGDERPEIIATWREGIFGWDVDASDWVEVSRDTTNKGIAAGNFVRSGIADVAAIFQIPPDTAPGGPGLYYLNGLTGAATKLPGSAPPPFSVTAGDLTGD